MTMTKDYLEQIRSASEKAFPFVERCGLQVLEVAPRYCHLRMPLKGNHNHIGTMYAGALCTLAEFPGGVIYLTSFDTSRYVPILKNIDMRFRRPATTDIDIKVSLDEAEVERISAEADKNGKCDFDWTVELKDANGEVVAIANSTYQLRAIGK